MNTQSKAEEPALIQTECGFSVLYKNRYLYSRYNPQKQILTAIQEAHILPNTLIFCFSPVLGYGLPELLQKIPEHCCIVCIEIDRILHDFSLKSLPENTLKNPLVNTIQVNSTQDFAFFLNEFFKTHSLGQFKRCLFLSLSGGTQFYEKQYTLFKLVADDFVSQYWKNRITLIKLGRLFVRNIFKNIKTVPNYSVLVKKSVSKPILVLGAGPSLDFVIEHIKTNASLFFILAVDSVLTPLLKRGITPDAVIALESQLANEKAFVGAKNTKIPLIADISSRPSILRILNGDAAFVFSEFCTAHFLDTVKNVLQNNITPIPPLGSVGLAALEVALFLRQNENVPIFFAGLDFSFFAAKSHCRGTPHLNHTLQTHFRLNPVENVESSFAAGNFYVAGKNKILLITSTVLQNYAQLLTVQYASKPNLFDISPCGIDTGSKQCGVNNAIETAKKFEGTQKSIFMRFVNKNDLQQKISDYVQGEIVALKNLQQMLKTGSGTREQICAAIKNREYLFLHFADGHLGVQHSIGFFKRIRTQIDFMLKDMEN